MKSSRGPLSAAMAASWLTAVGLVVLWPWMTSSALATSGGVIDQPMRQPVMAWVFETPSTTMMRWRRSGSTSAGDSCLKPS